MSVKIPILSTEMVNVLVRAAKRNFDVSKRCWSGIEMTHCLKINSSKLYFKRLADCEDIFSITRRQIVKGNEILSVHMRVGSDEIYIHSSLYLKDITKMHRKKAKIC